MNLENLVNFLKVKFSSFPKWKYLIGHWNNKIIYYLQTAWHMITHSIRNNIFFKKLLIHWNTTKRRVLFITSHIFLNIFPPGTSLVVQWLRICLPVQGRQVWSLVGGDYTCLWATTPEPTLLFSTTQRRLRFTTREASTVKSLHTTTRVQPLVTPTRESPHAGTKTHCSQ